MLLAACGKKGPPLAPLHLVPDVIADAAARRADDQVRIRFTMPAKNANGPGAVNLEKVEVFAATIAAGAITPPNRDLVVPKFLVRTVAVKPVPKEGEAAPEGDVRPAPGGVALFLEQLTPENLNPDFTAMPVAAAADPAAVPVPAAPAAAAPPPAPLTRIYLLRGVARGGRPGPVSARIAVPLTPPPAPPTDVKATFTSAAVSVTWVPPADAATLPVTPGYNVYAPGAAEPLNEKPLAQPPFERPAAEFGKEQCFVVRTVMQAGTTTIESAASQPQCVTPSDIFPPADPKGLSAVASSGAINLIWDANTDADLAGYLVLRGESPGDKLQAITPSPIQTTTYSDTTVKPGVRYVYAIVAVDRATPPNVSGQSMRVEETAR